MGRPRLNKSKSDANKEYLEKYREKNSEKYKKPDNERKKMKLQTLKYLEPIKYKEHLEKDRMRKKEYRERKKQEQQSQQQNDSNGSSATLIFYSVCCCIYHKTVTPKER